MACESNPVAPTCGAPGTVRVPRLAKAGPNPAAGRPKAVVACPTAGCYNSRRGTTPLTSPSPSESASRFLHASDIHLLDLAGVRPWRYFNKRFTGWVNLALRRGKSHDGDLFDEIVRQGHAHGVDRIVLTGDLTNLALEPEFALVRERLDRAGLPVTVIPGNHDVYTRGSYRARRFEDYLGHHQAGEREDDHYYPFVQRLGKIALIGVSSAIPSLPLYAVGRIGTDQLARLDRILEGLGQEGLQRVVLVHHPVSPGVSKARHDLLDLDAFGEVIRRRGAELVLHGHEHRLVEGALDGPFGLVPVHGISSGTSKSVHQQRRAGFSIYDMDPRGLRRRVFQHDGAVFVPVEDAA